MRLPALVLLAALAAPAGAQTSTLPAFPGAMGFAGASSGGRGGDVYIVENLNASGPGSFEQGIRTVPPEGRTIVFAVSGHIPIRKPKLTQPNVTIAGQTAPGDGVALKGSSFLISGSNVVVRFLRFHHGRRGNGGDSLNTDSGAAGLILDHCDVLFSADENFSMFRTAPPTMTFQWSINAWGLQTHSCGGLWLTDRTTAHHTLWAHNHTRNPKCITPRLLDWANNVTFGWNHGFNLAGADIPGNYQANIRGSTFVHGGKKAFAIFGGGRLTNGHIPYSVHVDDCTHDGNGNGTLDFSATNRGIIDGSNFTFVARPFPQTESVDAARPRDPVLGVPLEVVDRATAYKQVLSQTGTLRLDARSERPLRDEVTTLLIEDLVNQNRRMIADEKELGVSNDGLGTLQSQPPGRDSDRDGMPDVWERTLGSNPERADHNAPLPYQPRTATTASFFPGKTPAGYTRLEEYLHFLAIPHAILTRAASGTVEPLTVDLRRYTSGFTNGPVFTVSAIFGGTVRAGGEGNHRVTFTPHAKHTGRARFDFTVKDRDGSEWTQTCAILVPAR